MAAAADREIPGQVLTPYLQALMAAGVSLEDLLQQAEAHGADPEHLGRIARQGLPRLAAGDPELAALSLALGCARNWKPLRTRAHGLGAAFLAPLTSTQPRFQALNALPELLGDKRGETVRRKVLRRLGYPLRNLKPIGLPEVNPPGAVPWLDAGRSLVADDLELRGFSNSALEWAILMGNLVLRDGRGPTGLRRCAGPWRNWDQGWYSLRLFRVRRLRELRDLGSGATLVAVACPDLEAIDGAPRALVAVDCPRLARIGTASRLRLLHLERCPRLESLGPDGAPGEPGGAVESIACRSLLLADCPNLRALPAHLLVDTHVLLRRMGPFSRWPRSFRIGGNLNLQDCPGLQELPPVEVGGSIWLPPHLQRPGTGWVAPGPAAAGTGDRYPELRSLLLGLEFADLCRGPEAPAIGETARTVLRHLQDELRGNPRIEAVLLWTASEVWRDLAEERWGAARSRFQDGNAADGELPVAWFRDLLSAG